MIVWYQEPAMLFAFVGFWLIGLGVGSLIVSFLVFLVAE